MGLVPTIYARRCRVELGDGGQAVHRAARYRYRPSGNPATSIDLAAAHAMRRQIGEARHDLQEAEKIAPEQTRTQGIVTRDLLQLSGLPSYATSPSDSACSRKLN